MKFLPQADFRRLAAAGQAGGRGVLRVTAGQPRAYDDGTRRIRFCFSDGSIDRMGDTIDPAGWELADFQANPVALWAHDSGEPPIGRASNVGREGQRLMGTIEFASADAYPFADTIYKLVIGGFLSAVSVGFLPLEYSFVENDPERGWGIDFKRQELLEISVCPIPANANALLAQARSLGLGLHDTRRLRQWMPTAIERQASVSDLSLARRDRDLARARFVAARVAGHGAAARPEPEPEPWMVEYAAEQQREAEQRAAHARQVGDALRLAVPRW